MEEARKEVGEIIDRLAVIYDEEDVNSPDILNAIGGSDKAIKNQYE